MRQLLFAYALQNGFVEGDDLGFFYVIHTALPPSKK